MGKRIRSTLLFLSFCHLQKFLSITPAHLGAFIFTASQWERAVLLDVFYRWCIKALKGLSHLPVVTGNLVAELAIECFPSPVKLSHLFQAATEEI